MKGIKDFLGKIKPKSNNESDKNKKVNSDEVRVRVNRLVGNVPSEIYISTVTIQKDKYNNSILMDEESGFKEEFPEFVNPLVSDIKSKLDSFGLEKDDQIRKVEENIKKKELILSKAKNGKLEVEHKDTGKKEEININLETEKANLRLLKVTLYSLKNKNKEGSFFKIEEDGVRCLTYLIVPEGLIPYWYNTPTVNGEPVTLTPDMSLRKKYFYDNEQERLDDLKDLIDTPINRILKVISMALIIIVALANIGWSVYNAQWGSDLREESLLPELDRLELEIVQTKKECADQLANQLTNNGVILDWASLELQKDIDVENAKKVETDKANAQI